MGGGSWVEAARPRTLPAAIVPVLVGSSVAVWNGTFDWRAFLLTLVAAVAIQIAANFANDASDAAHGADTTDRVGPPRMVASGLIASRDMWIATWAMVAIAAACGGLLTVMAGPVVLLIGLASVAAMLGYVGGPLPYGYRGLGEVFVFVFFGLVATIGSQFVHGGAVERQTWLLAIPVGLLATTILVVNNLRDLDTDARAGKRTLAVMIGDGRTRWLYRILMVGALGLIALLGTFSIISPWTLSALATIPLAVRLLREVSRAEDRLALVPALGQTALLHLLVGVGLAIGTVFGPVA
ncbi:MAG: 1,4-dihydroxy-2-naphthoate polyprenyltransferase [Acidimicrobiia bacterium]